MSQSVSKRSFGRKDFIKIKRNFLKLSAEIIRFEIASHSAESTKLGITVSKKYGNAVSRNRFKRLVREAFRARYSFFPKGTMVHALAKSHKKLTFDQVSTDFDQLLSTVSCYGSTPSPLSGALQAQS